MKGFHNKTILIYETLAPYVVAAKSMQCLGIYQLIGQFFLILNLENYIKIFSYYPMSVNYINYINLFCLFNSIHWIT